MEQEKNGLGKDLLSSLVVTLLALPLCMGIAIACGLPTHKGLLTGVVGGVLVGLMSSRGSRLVTGPSTGLTVTVMLLVQQYGPLALGPVVALVGLIQLLAGSVKVGRVFLMVSPAVVRGMLSGIGIVLVLSQLHIVLDHTPHGSTLDNFMALPEALIQLLSPDSKHKFAATIGALTIVVMIVWRLLKLDKRLHLPEALPAIVLATFAAWYFGFTVHRVDVPDTLSEMVSLVNPAQFASLLDWNLLKAALSLAVLASAETLLTVASLEQSAPNSSEDYNKVLVTQGIGNLVCGALGSLPLTGGIVRSRANIEAGGRSRWSMVLQGLWLVLAVAALPWLLETIPTSALAALLVVAGFRLMDWAAIKELWKHGWGEVVIFLTTVALVVCVNLLVGVGVGLALAFIRVAWKVMRVQVTVTQVQREGRECYHVNLAGAASFLSKPAILSALQNVPKGAEVHIHFNGLMFIDHAALDALTTFASSSKHSGGRVLAVHPDGELKPLSSSEDLNPRDKDRDDRS